LNAFSPLSNFNFIGAFTPDRKVKQPFDRNRNKPGYRLPLLDQGQVNCELSILLEELLCPVERIKQPAVFIFPPDVVRNLAVFLRNNRNIRKQLFQSFINDVIGQSVGFRYWRAVFFKADFPVSALPKINLENLLTGLTNYLQKVRDISGDRKR